MRRSVVVLGALALLGAGTSDSKAKKTSPAKVEKAPVEKVDHAEKAAFWLKEYEDAAALHQGFLRFGQADEKTRGMMNEAREEFLKHCRATKRDELDCTDRLDQALERAKRRRY